MINGMLGLPWCAGPVDWQGAVRSLVFLALLPLAELFKLHWMVNRRITGPGPGNDALLRIRDHSTINANGTFTVAFDTSPSRSILHRGVPAHRALSSEHDFTV